LKNYIEHRAVEIGQYIVENNTTVRETAKKFGISKSTVHKDVSDRLVLVNGALAKDVRRVLDHNKEERHIRGGLATKDKYRKEKSEKNSKKTSIYTSLGLKTYK